MEPLQKQVNTLSQKVDELHQVIDQLSGKMNDALSECRLAPIPEMDKESLRRHPARGYSTPNSTMEHKDVLSDGTCLDANRQSGEKELTPEIQIQRLTAQLTAAYNRIAALEEQLLARRIQ
ncbi:MAG: hypothetical protein JOZ78_25235 [Chroococcidiopsidaceae cyanobacterium CP_BM_ER_R8_30]|nr:hypothetical protein [Chroococcidiopsidaceae cyanobacterium CP_BM_ER_R8_30]